MFIRKKITPKKHTVVQIVENHRNESTTIQRVLRHIGTAKNPQELEQMIAVANTIKIQMEQALLAKKPQEFAGRYASVIGNWKEPTAFKKINIHQLEEVERVTLGIHDIYGAVYDTLGFNNLFTRPQHRIAAAKILREIVLGRIAQPTSKRATVNLLATQFGCQLDLDQVYQVMDKINDLFIERLQQRVLSMTLKLTGEKLRVMFYDATTLYFESFNEDELKQNGYSKDMKFNQAQVLLTLFVTERGLPIGYELFPGATFEGHTLIPVLEKLKTRYQIDEVIFVADRGLLSDDNLKYLEENNFNYIVGARIKNSKKSIKSQILDPSLYKEMSGNTEQKIAIFKLDDNRKLIINHSPKRAYKDQQDRIKAITKLQKKLSKSKEPKSLLNNYGYKKYIQIHGVSTISINAKKIEEDAQWDGLLGVTTNMQEINPEQIFGHYRSLWQIESCFRINKHDLKIRPIYHWAPKRISAHIAISFMAFACVKYLEYRLSIQSEKISPEVIRQALSQIQATTIYDHGSNQTFILPSKVHPIAKEIYRVMGIKIPKYPVII